MRRVRGLATAALAVLLALGASSAAFGAGPLEVTAIPSTVALSPDHATTVTLAIQNTGTVALGRVTVQAIAGTSAGVDVSVRPRRAITLGPGETRLLTATIGAARPSATAGTVELLVRFTHGEGGGPRSGVAHATVTLSPPAALDASSAASVELQAPARVRSGRDAPLYASVTNRSSYPLAIGSVERVAPESFEVRWTKPPADERTVDPGQTLTLVGTLAVPDRVRAGPEPLIVAVHLRAPPDGRALTLVATRAVEVTHTGESELLTALGIPALVLAPGFLLLATMILLSKLSALREPWDTRPFPLDLAGKEFWVPAIVVSFATVFAYRRIRDIDLFDAYGAGDVAWLWTISIALGAVLYLLYMLVRNHRHAERAPTEQDRPLELLCKLGKQGLGLKRDRVTVGADAQRRTLYLVEPADPLRPTTWLSPGIELAWLRSDPAVEHATTMAIRSNDAAAVARHLERACAAGTAELRYSPDGREFRGPRAVARERLGDPLAAESIVQLNDWESEGDP